MSRKIVLLIALLTVWLAGCNSSTQPTLELAAVKPYLPELSPACRKRVMPAIVKGEELDVALFKHRREGHILNDIIEVCRESYESIRKANGG